MPGNQNQSSSSHTEAANHSYRFHAPHLHLQSAFGDDWFALKADAFARFFGTPSFLIAQTAIVAIWILVNIFGLTSFDIYPFILLNLAFSRDRRVVVDQSETPLTIPLGN